MNNDKSLYNPWVISATLGLSSIAGFIFGKLLGQQKQSANKILQKTVQDFKKEGTVEGSWIDEHARPFQRFANKTAVYQGGVQRREDDQLVNYVFLADAYTGSLLKIKRLEK